MRITGSTRSVRWRSASSLRRRAQVSPHTPILRPGYASRSPWRKHARSRPRSQAPKAKSVQGEGMKPLKILYWMPNPHELGAARFVYLSWRNGILASGNFFYTLTSEHGDWERRVDEIKPDIFFLTNLSDLERTAEILARIRKKGVFVFQVVMLPSAAPWLEAIRTLDPADIYFGDREYDSMTEFSAIT